jgi:hypothetical protein
MINESLQPRRAVLRVGTLSFLVGKRDLPT